VTGGHPIAGHGDEEPMTRLRCAGTGVQVHELPPLQDNGHVPSTRLRRRIARPVHPAEAIFIDSS
jgi:hypothetical protein